MSKLRVKDFTYYPLMGDSFCAFRVPTKPGTKTYHQCERYFHRELEGYKFCERHAAVVERKVKDNEQ